MSKTPDESPTTDPEYLEPDPYIENEWGKLSLGRCSNGAWLFIEDEVSCCSIGLSQAEVARLKAGLEEAIKDA